jgi:alpha-beta hydrolase superfamily lysophospholipase
VNDSGHGKRRIALGVLLTVLLLPSATGSAGAAQRASSATDAPAPSVDPTQSAETPVPPGAWFVDESKLPFTALDGTSATQQWGLLAGAGYHIEIPDRWNGELVMFAHGFRGLDNELTVSDPPFRRYLIEHGYAWAASSYRANGYVPSLGEQDTYDLSKLFASKLGPPSRIFMTGLSMGGHITGVAIQKRPNYYAGAMPVCGVMADRELFDYFTDVVLGAEAITGITTDYPVPANWLTDIVPLLKWVLSNDPARLSDFTNLVMYRSGGPRPYFPLSLAQWTDFLLTLAQEDPRAPAAPASNENTVYKLSSDPQLSADELLLNAVIARVNRLNYPLPPAGISDAPAITGELSIPVLTMHTIGDLFVPFSMEQGYARRAATQGDSDLLVQRAIRDIGHCAFSQGEWDQAFADLAHWVHDGVKPAGDDVLTPSVVAAPDYGCRFTVGQRSFVPACPVP